MTVSKLGYKNDHNSKHFTSVMTVHPSPHLNPLPPNPLELPCFSRGMQWRQRKKHHLGFLFLPVAVLWNITVTHCSTCSCASHRNNTNRNAMVTMYAYDNRVVTELFTMIIVVNFCYFSWSLVFLLKERGSLFLSTVGLEK